MSDLPRLVYIGDVPVEASYHGSALLFRLLESYPSNHVMIIEAGLQASRSDRRGKGFFYKPQLLPLERLSRTRFAGWYETVALRFARRRSSILRSVVEDFRPDAVLTVTHGFSWLSAAEIAQKSHLPLHVICHDEWARAGSNQAWKEKIFAKYYCSASSRLCVSPFMSEEYERRYGARGEVLYPSRARDAVPYDFPPARLADETGPLTCVFAGTINSPGVVAALKSLATCLKQFGGRLIIFGPLTAGAARASGLVGTNIELGGLLSSSELVQRMRDIADVLYVPMSFTETDRNNMQICFPSKLTDYTAIGVPLIIHGPAYCSAVRWALENRGVAEVVPEEGSVMLSKAIARIAAAPAYRIELGRRALEVGETYFSHRAASLIFNRALIRGHAEYRGAGVRRMPVGAALS